MNKKYIYNVVLASQLILACFNSYMKLSGGKSIIGSIVRHVINNINNIALVIAIDELLNYMYLNS